MENGAKPLITVVEHPNVLDYPCDVLVLKYAQAFYGADSEVAGILLGGPGKKPDLEPAPGESVLVSTRGKLAARDVLFVGVVPLGSIGYGEIRELAQRALRELGQRSPEVEHIAMTIHGVGRGLDERESFLAQIGGLLDSVGQQSSPRALRKISIVEKNSGRRERLRRILEEITPLPSRSAPRELSLSTPTPRSAPNPLDAGLDSESKKHIFVAMPFDDSMDDVFELGIQEKVSGAGFLCERLDKTPFLGDVLDRIKRRIETASLVIADISGGNPNVYLEVGYAWGKGRPTLLIAKQEEVLKFDVQGQRCIKYKSIVDLRKQLDQWLANPNAWIE
jgi:hypothetical protein